MIGKVALGLYLAICGSMALGVEPVAKLQLPCDSAYQDLSPTGTQVLAYCKDHSAQAVEIPSGAHREVSPAKRGGSAYAYSRDGRWLAIGFPDGAVRVISADDAMQVKEWKASERRIALLYFFPDAKALLVAPLDSPGQVWGLASAPTQRASLPTEFGGVNAVAVSPDGKLLASAAGDTVIRFYDTASWQKIREYGDFLLDTFSLQFTRDGKRVLAGGADARITVLDAATAKQVRQLPAEAGSYITSIDLLDEGQRAVTVYEDDAGVKPPHALIWDLAAGTSVPLQWKSLPSCGGVVAGKLWLCQTEGRTLTISEQ